MAGRRQVDAPGGGGHMLSTPATVALTSTGVAFTVHPYRHDGRAVVKGASYGLEAAAALGVPAGQVFKTLVAEVDGAGPRGGPGLVVAVLAVDSSLDLRALAAVFGAKRAALAQRREAERVTGYVVGGISPFGQRRPLATVVDAAALAWATVYVSAGRRGVDVALSPADLIAVTSAAVAGITG